ncbi:uncharacterized protein Z518_06745 [Rhinocladiella mackenziei CBS 650.93]|uniref:Uncharacterized protein n=1 Tax=Rhinocladiella mackenziei CBS 650.93 TaxID=1442369 RepID=A0A0D2GY97_9EURO|nr:uncharacterized protein Z518_06745 [Rhinocladiella mackenziei CBS 650.93]KIX03193.1 hypothetical protein Z518_06745 [Rhinocladiella mackenziei CBS 650.93]
MDLLHPLEYDPSTNAADEPASRGRKRKPSNKGEILEWKLSSMFRHIFNTACSVAVRPRKKARMTSPTISPSLLPIVDLVDVQSEMKSDDSLLPMAADLTMIDLGDAESECDSRSLDERDG